MENYIVINGKKAELTEEQLEKLGIKTKEETKESKKFDRVKNEERYYYIDYNDEVADSYEYYFDTDEKLFNTANYCTDKELLKQRALHETLNRLLWRYTYKHGWHEDEWKNDKKKFSIFKNMITKQFSVHWCQNSKGLGNIYFLNEEIAKKAINEIILPFIKKHPDFKW